MTFFTLTKKIKKFTYDSHLHIFSEESTLNSVRAEMLQWSFLVIYLFIYIFNLFFKFRVAEREEGGKKTFHNIIMVQRVNHCLQLMNSNVYSVVQNLYEHFMKVLYSAALS